MYLLVWFPKRQNPLAFYFLKPVERKILPDLNKSFFHRFFIACLILHSDSCHIIHFRSHKNITNKTMFQRSILNNSQNWVVWQDREWGCNSTTAEFTSFCCLLLRNKTGSIHISVLTAPHRAAIGVHRTLNNEYLGGGINAWVWFDLSCRVTGWQRTPSSSAQGDRGKGGKDEQCQLQKQVSEATFKSSLNCFMSFFCSSVPYVVK